MYYQSGYGLAIKTFPYPLNLVVIIRQLTTIAHKY